VPATCSKQDATFVPVHADCATLVQDANLQELETRWNVVAFLKASSNFDRQDQC